MASRKTPERKIRRRGYSHATHRLREIERIIGDRHNGQVPDTDDADLYLVPVGQCFRRMFMERGSVGTREVISRSLSFWCEQWAPHVKVVEGIVRATLSGPAGIKADALGARLRLSDTDRTRLKIRTIGAYDVNRKTRAKRRQESKRIRDRERARLKRIAQGAVSRGQYLAGSLSQTKPWEVLGISRRTYERRRKAQAQISSIGCRKSVAPSLLLILDD